MDRPKRNDGNGGGSDGKRDIRDFGRGEEREEKQSSRADPGRGVEGSSQPPKHWWEKFRSSDSNHPIHNMRRGGTGDHPIFEKRKQYEERKQQDDEKPSPAEWERRDQAVKEQARIWEQEDRANRDGSQGGQGR